MLIELRKGMTLLPGIFNAVISPGKVMIFALNSYTDLQRFLFPHACSNYLRILSSISRSSGNFEIGIVPTDEITGTTLYRSSRSPRTRGIPPYAQRILEVS
ncbi:MAG: hypothetical protein WC294_06965 [Methanoregula sp.]|jgi:hypothetical protein